MQHLRNSVAIYTGILLLPILVLFYSCQKDNCYKGISKKVYVANEESGSVSVLDGETYEVIETVDITYKSEMLMPHNLQVAPDNQSIWVTGVPMEDHLDEYIIVLKGKGDRAKEHINLGQEQHLAHVILDDSSSFAYATANESGQVIKIDASTYKEVGRFDLGASSAPHGLRYMNGNLYVACMGSSEMAIVDVSSGVISSVPVGGIAVQTAVLPSLGSVFVSVYDLKQVVRYDVSSGDTTVIHLPSEAQGPIQLYPSPDNQRVYVCDQGIVNGNPSSNKLYVISTNTNTVTNTVTVGDGAHGVTVSPDGTTIFVTNLDANTVSVVNATSLTVLSTISVGESPNGISYLECD